MRRWLLALAIAAAVAGCDADRVSGDDATTLPSAAVPTTSPAADVTPPADAMPDDGLPPADGTTVPARFQGAYATDAAACGAPGHESHLTIGADNIAFHESSGTITSVAGTSVASDADDLTVVAILTGEGETREATYRFRLSADGNTLTDMTSGPGMVRQRCG